MKADAFQDLMASVRQAGQILRGERKAARVFRIESPDIKRIRKQLHVSQDAFAHMIGVSVNTLQNWEQGRRAPVGPARALLTVAARNPKAVLDALHA